MNMVNNVIRGLFVAVVGIVLIAFNESVMPLLVRLLGLVFLMPALISSLNLYMTRKDASFFPMIMMSVINGGSVILGILLMLFPVAFIEFFVILLALLLLGFSLLQIYSVASLYRASRHGAGLFVVPVLLLIFSIAVLFNPFGLISTATMMIGISLVVSGCSDVVISVVAKRNVSTDLRRL